MRRRDRRASLRRRPAPIALWGALGLGGCAEPPSHVPGGGQGDDLGDALYGVMGEPLPSIDDEQRARFERGREVALRRFSPSQGLGPEWSGSFCLACHDKPTPGGTASRYRDVFVERGDDFELPFVPHWSTSEPGHTPGPAGSATTVRSPAPLYGLGLLAQIPAEEIVLRADPNDRDGDGVSGRVNFERGFVGRFGRKAQIATLSDFVRLALLDHMGVTTDPLGPSDPSALLHAPGPVELPTTDSDSTPDPELGHEELSDLFAFVALLAPPAPAPPSALSEQGERAFDQCGCTSCHTPSLTGPHIEIRAYTDLLLHDMGPMLDDGVELGQARSTEFRTAPLWGLAAVGPYLHDGRADTIDEAIGWHDGEAAASRRCYQQLELGDRAAMDTFLGSLGGHEWRPDGKLSEEAPVPAPGEAGGPRAPLSSTERARFERGRDLFDHDFGRDEGLGPRFNGDSCRSCHFDPVIGGAGPAGVDAVRAFADGGDPLGSVAHRFDVAGPRPEPEPAHRHERRQTPTTLGLGLIDEIPAAAIEANADPDDRDGDGIRGRVQRLADGSVGRFGWHAQIPTLADFIRDAMSTELGVTVPAAPSPFGTSEDDDAYPDPELREGELEDLRFFMARLAPPARRSLAPEAEARGESSFATLGCATCHRPEMTTEAGEAVPLFSDLLLHDVETGGDFRTPPLWGVGQTGPYLHDGSAESLRDAILAHGAEGQASVQAFTDLSTTEVDDLMAFLRSL